MSARVQFSCDFLIRPPRKVRVVAVPGKGRGVVATEPIAKGELIEVCPVIDLSEKERKFVDTESDVLSGHALYKPEDGSQVLMLGYGSLYNHSREPNAELDYDPAGVRFVALADIAVDEEIVYDYDFDDGVEIFLDLGVDDASVSPDAGPECGPDARQPRV